MITDAVRTGGSTALQMVQSNPQSRSDSGGSTPNQRTEIKDSVEISAEARKLLENTTGEQVAGKHETEIVGPLESTSVQSSKRELKDAEAQRLDTILADLRGKFDEEEVMARFTEIMRGEGYEIQEIFTDPFKEIYNQNSTVGMRASISSGGSHIGLRMAALGMGEVPESNVDSYDHTSRYFTYSTMVGVQSSNGDTGYAHGTYAVYNAFDWDNYTEAVDSIINRNIDERSEKSGIDLKAYTQSLSSDFADRFSAQSVNTDLAEVVTNILQQSGLTLNQGQEISFSFVYNELGNPSGLIADLNFKDEEFLEQIQISIDNAIHNDSSILSSFLAESDKAGTIGVESLAEHFQNSVQSLQFRESRRFVISGDNQSILVTGSEIYAQSKGYRYQKKISDSFDYSADDFVFKADRKSTDMVFGQVDLDMARLGAESLQKYTMA